MYIHIALFRLATARTNLKQFEEAIADFECLLQLDPSNKKAHDQLKELRSKHGKQNGAEKHVKKNRLHIVEVEGCGGDGEEEDSEEARDKKMMQGLLKTLEKKGKKEKEREKGAEAKAKMGPGVKLGGTRGSNKRDGKKRGKKGRRTEDIRVGVGESSPQPGSVVEQTDSFETLEKLSSTPVVSKSREDTPPEPIKAESSKHESPPTIAQATPSLVQTPPPLPPHVQQLKDTGNELFRSGRYSDAVVKYSLAIHQLEKGEVYTVHVRVHVLVD